jgi:hypothetical protein
MEISVKTINKKRALKAANDMEKALGEIANGRLKPAQLPVEALAVLIQFARDTRPAKDWISVKDGYVIFSRSNFAHSNGDKQLDFSRALLQGCDGDIIAHYPKAAYGDTQHLKTMLENS